MTPRSLVAALGCVVSCGGAAAEPPATSAGGAAGSSGASAGGAASGGAAGAGAAGAGAAGAGAAGAGAAAGGAGGAAAGGAAAGGSGGSPASPGEDALSPDFRAWLDGHGYAAEDFARDALPGGAFGGCDVGGAPTREPVVLVHGNSDRALGGPAHGFTATRDHLLLHGYRPCELYATTWGPADASQASSQDHARATVLRVRRFVEAVLGYTGAARVDVIAHSMGVTLARLAIQGGPAADAAGAYEVGPGLGARVDAFIGIAGANRGLTACFSSSSLPTCGKIAGLYPGALVGVAVTGRSKLLDTLDASPHDEGARVHSIWSPDDELIGFGGVVWGQPTSRIPAADADHQLPGLGHLALKDETVELQRALLEP